MSPKLAIFFNFYPFTREKPADVVLTMEKTTWMQNPFPEQYTIFTFFLGKEIVWPLELKTQSEFVYIRYHCYFCLASHSFFINLNLDGSSNIVAPSPFQDCLPKQRNLEQNALRRCASKPAWPTSSSNQQRWASTSILMSVISDIRHRHLLFRYRRQICQIENCHSDIWSVPI